MALVTSVEGTQVPLPSAPDAVQRHRQDGDGHSATRPPHGPQRASHLGEDHTCRVILDVRVTGNDSPQARSPWRQPFLPEQRFRGGSESSRLAKAADSLTLSQSWGVRPAFLSHVLRSSFGSQWPGRRAAHHHPGCRSALRLTKPCLAGGACTWLRGTQPPAGPLGGCSQAPASRSACVSYAACAGGQGPGRALGRAACPRAAADAVGAEW